MERCPHCRARDQGGPVCRRCGMALDLLRRVEDAAQAQLRLALVRLAQGDPVAAAAAAHRSLALHRTPLAERLSGFIAHGRSDSLLPPAKTLDEDPADRSAQDRSVVP